MSKPVFETRNPSTGKPLKSYTGHDAADVEHILADAHSAWRQWKRTSFAERAAVLNKAAALLRERALHLAELMADEMGKPLQQGRSEAEKCAWVCEHYAAHAEAMLTRTDIEADAAHSYVAHRPLGIILAVMPWNFPLWQVFRFAAPALMAGNAGLLKHAPNVLGCAVAIEAIFRAAGLPAGVFQLLFVEVDAVEAIIADDRVAGATLTGSTRAGSSVGSLAGKYLKPSVLELGGSDPYIVFADADLDAAVKTCVASRLINSGQTCISAKRFLVEAPIYDDFVDRFVREMDKLVMGDPRHPESDLGPQARPDLRDQLHHQVDLTIQQGARCLLGGRIPDKPGAWYPPTVLVDVPEGSPAARDELFGPVAAIFRFATEAEAITMANDTRFGLGAAVFTADLERGRRIAEEELDAGACFVNTFVKSDPRLPFGGIKGSGYGRELGELGIKAFVNAKTVYVA